MPSKSTIISKLKTNEKRYRRIIGFNNHLGITYSLCYIIGFFTINKSKNMKKLAIELEVGDKIELLNGIIGVISGICVNGEKRKVTILYENGMKTYALADEEVEILSD